MNIEYQFTVDGFTASGFGVGPLSFPQETFDVLLPRPLVPDQPINGLAYNVHGDGSYDFFFTPVTGQPYIAFYPPGAQPPMDPLASITSAALFRVNIFVHYPTYVEIGQPFVGGYVTTPKAASVPEPAMMLLWAAALAAWIFRSKLCQHK